MWVVLTQHFLSYLKIFSLPTLVELYFVYKSTSLQNSFEAISLASFRCKSLNFNFNLSIIHNKNVLEIIKPRQLRLM